MAKMLLPHSSPVTPRVPATALFDGTRWSKAVVCAGLLTVTLCQAVHAAPGDLDTSFDADGKVLTDFRPRSPTRSNETARAVVVQPDGKLVAAGGPRFLLARYHPDGSLDSLFGTGGLVDTGFSASAFATALALQPDGKLVAAGGSGSGDGSPSDFALARYHPNGRLDTSFDGDGLVLTSLGMSASANALIVQPDGKVVAAGIVRASDSSGNLALNFALARYHLDGSLDTTFGVNGLVLGSFLASLGVSTSANALVVQPDGKLVVAGSGAGNFALARYHADGTLDTTFDIDGLVLTRFGVASSANALVVQPDGKLVAAGRAGGASSVTSADFALARYHPDGTLDTSFDGDGLVLTDIAAREVIFALVLETDGKLVALGPSVGNFALARYHPDGSLDNDFGGNGLMMTTFGLSEFAGALALQPDGRLVAAGGSNTSGDRDFALARYLSANEQPPLPPACGGVSATTLGTARDDTVRGTRLADVIMGLRGDDTIRGLGGDDILCGGPGNDEIVGGDGNDRILGERGSDRIFGDLGALPGGGQDNLFGGSGDDLLMGGPGNDRLHGNSGNDQIFGNKGRDRLSGGNGDDRCDGGRGPDAINTCENRNAGSHDDPRRDPPETPNDLCPPIANVPPECGLD